LAGALVGGVLGKLAARYGAPWKWKKLANLTVRIKGLLGDLIDGVKTLFKACKHSFAPGTLVLLADGSTRPIEELKPGDRVKATDPQTGKTVVRAVVATHINLDLDLTDLVVSVHGSGDKTIKTTQSHPFWSESRQDWVEAAQLLPGESLRAYDGSRLTVRDVRSYVGNARMYDLTVDVDHTYYVMAGNTPVLVHNCGEQHVALGLEGDALENFAKKNGAETLMNDKDWRGTVWTAANLLKFDNPGIRISFNLDNMHGVENGVASAVGQSLSRNARQIGGATDLELAFFHDAGTLGKVDFYVGGIKQLNPFG
jgi:hypothetical protein